MQTTAIAMVDIVCGECGICFGIPEGYNQSRRERGDTFYCPNGHGRAYVDSEVRKLERQLAQERAKCDQALAAQRQANLERVKALKDLADQKALVARKQRRAVSGTCPCCRRNFANVQRHMKTKHPQEVDKATIK